MMKSLSILAFTFNTFSIAFGANMTPDLEKLKDFKSQYCKTDADSLAHSTQSGFRVTAAADDVIKDAYLDGVRLNGMIGSNHGRSKGWQTVDLTEDEFKKDCTDTICEHVLTIRTQDTGAVITGFIAVVEVNGKTYKTGLDSTWKGIPFDQWDDSWKDIHFDDGTWPVAGTLPGSSGGACYHGGWRNKFEYHMGARWVDALGCKSNFGLGRVYRLRFQSGTCPPPTMSPTSSPTMSPTSSPTVSPTSSPTVSPTSSPTSSAVTQDNSCDVKETNNDKCPNILFVHEWDARSNSARRDLNVEVLKKVRETVDDIIARRKTPCTTPYGVTEVSKIDNLEDFDVTSDLYTQVWLMQLNYKMPKPAAGSDKDLKYRSLAQWFNEGYVASRHSAIILDGRIASSTTGGKQWSQKGSYSHPTDMKIVTNYVENLHKRGGGLFLGTDHGVDKNHKDGCGEFTCGINTVTDELNISEFWGFFPKSGQGRDKKVAYVDTASPLMTTPEIAYESTTSAMVPNYTCTDASQCPLNKVYDQVVWDHTSTSQTAIGLQENGMIFYSVAFHSGSVTKPAIATNIKGGLNFQIGVDTPTCNECFVTKDSFTLAARVEVESRAPYGNWEVTYTGTDNPLPEASTFQTSDEGRSFTLTTLPLKAGNHSFKVSATDANGWLDSTIVKVTVDAYGCFDASPWYGNNPGPCFEWNVIWPCRGCANPYNPNGPSYGGNRGGGGGGGGCPPADNPDYAVWCVDGFQPCANGVPKCVSDPLNPPPRACDPEPNTLCGGGNTDKGKEDEDGDKDSKPKPTPEDEEEEEDDEEEDGDGDPKPTPNDEEEEEEEEEEDGDGDPKPTPNDEEEEEKKRKGPFRPFPIPIPQDCEDCPKAQFKCHEAQCDEWDCLWWCRCYDENVVYTCEDDNDPCDCEQFGADLYNVTYEDLACSPYMDVKFSGPGAEKYNNQKECCRDPTKSMSDCKLE